MSKLDLNYSKNRELWAPTLQTKNKSDNNCKVIYVKAKTWQSQLYFNASLTFWNKVNA